jgi:hypothetical protein
LRSRTYLSRTTIANACTFGSYKFKKRVLATAVTNTSTFGSHSIASAAKKYSYSSTLGSGNRTGTITVTNGGVTAGVGSASQLVNGSTANEFWWNTGTNATLKFDLGSAKVIKRARWKQSNSSTHGTFKWQGSNDDEADTSYLYPCGGGVGVGGATVNGSGGNGTDRNPLIVVTSNYSTPDGIDPHNTIDGAGGNNGTDRISFAGSLSSASIIFDFAPTGKKHRIDEFTWEQNNSSSLGNWDWSGSDDGTN